eukprot:TRINITY_DN4721_c0_g1_i2.p1 TRINITY_DN4721_c0_g1~~TRINITY_DN4721_c0_g1_i2.p1  ORF type:complete len:448 (+),score=143.01 TRINITY_DN4721_c0_g1_i2:79-1422(+)
MRRDAVVVGAVNVVGGLLFGWVAVGVSTGVGVLWPCMYALPGEAAWGRALLQSAVNFGAAAAAVCGGGLAARIGLKAELTVAGLLSCCCMFSAAASTYAAQLCARLVTGLGMGLITQAAPQYVAAAAQALPDSDAGTLGALFQVAITFGILLASIASYVALGDHRDDPESAYCTAHTGEDLAARNWQLFAPAAAAAAAFTLLSVAVPPEPRAPQRGKHGQAVATPRRTWILGAMGCVALQLTGINAVMFYSAQFFALAGYAHVVFGSVCVMAWNFVTTLIALRYVNSFGRRPLMVTALGLIVASITLFAPASYLAASGTLSVGVCFVLLATYILGFELGPGTLFWIYLNEVTPQGSLLFPVANAGQWVGTIVVTFTFPPLQALLGPWVFWVFLPPALGAFVFHWRCLPETKDAASQARARRLLAAKDTPWNVWAAPPQEQGAPGFGL